jgi:hypothetical protein
VEVLPLHGNLSPAQQDAAIRWARVARRRLPRLAALWPWNAAAARD